MKMGKFLSADSHRLREGKSVAAEVTRRTVKIRAYHALPPRHLVGYWPQESFLKSG
jgi:hypothetical protein